MIEKRRKESFFSKQKLLWGKKPQIGGKGLFFKATVGGKDKTHEKHVWEKKRKWTKTRWCDVIEKEHESRSQTERKGRYETSGQPSGGRDMYYEKKTTGVHMKSVEC